MAGVKGKGGKKGCSGRKPLFTEISVMSRSYVLKLSQDVLIDALTNKNTPDNEKIDIAKTLYVKSIPQKLEGDGLKSVFQVIVNEYVKTQDANRLSSNQLV